MGGRIARRLVDGGEDVVGFDLDAARAADAGARAAESLAEVARAADVVLLSLPDSPAIEAVIDAIEGDLRGGQVLVDLSTASPASTAGSRAVPPAPRRGR
jgi:3-hydroxyisobutyrate dehydrogenase-like beta-hydroxyacid dehydrogenase